MKKRDDDDDRPRFKKRGKDSYKRRAEQSGGAYDALVKDGIPFLKEKDGVNRIRVCPPGWDDAEHYGVDVFQHGDVGADGQRYLCPEKWPGGGKCAVCEEGRNARGDEELVKKCRPTKRCAFYAINRDNPDIGPCIWIAPWKVDRDISAAAVDEETGDVLEPDNPDEGYDVFYRKSGAMRSTERTNFKMARTASPLSDNPKTMKKWLHFLVENPIPKVLVFHPYDRVRAVLHGEVETGKRAKDGDDEPSTRAERTEKPKNKIKDKLKKVKKKKAKPDAEDGEDIPF